jgi:hypothetical protein
VEELKSGKVEEGKLDARRWKGEQSLRVERLKSGRGKIEVGMAIKFFVSLVSLKSFNGPLRWF